MPSKVLDFDTPTKILHDHDPDYSMLRIFGCACWPNLRPYNTRKLAFRSTRCVFLGYSPLHKGYKCLDPSTGRVYISRDVIFDESIFPFSELHENAGARLRKEIFLLPDHLLPRGVDRTDPITANTNVPSCDDELQVHLGENLEENDATTASNHGAQAAAHDTLSGAHPKADSPAADSIRS